MATTRRALSDLGYIEGENISFDGRDAATDTGRFPALAAEIVALRPDVIVCQNVLAARALKAATTTIPIVFVQINADPLESELVMSLARPGGNVTGIGVAGAALASKRLQLLKEVAPRISRVAAIEDQIAPAYAVNEMLVAGRGLGVELVPIYIRNASDLDGALNAAVESRADALFHLAGFVTGTQTSAPRMAEFAIQHRWPTVGIAPSLGGLLAYNGTLVDPWKRAGALVDRILKGASPAEIPVEGPSGWALELNMCTAMKLGLTIPQSVLSQATKIVQCT
jgi:putative ABC transport system substrate-binding protein